MTTGWSAQADPFSPTNAGPPAVLVGRAKEEALLSTLIDRLNAGRSCRPLFLRGCRGIGKTVLLNELSRKCKRRGWVVVEFRPTGFRDVEEDLAQSINRAIRVAAGKDTEGRRIPGGKVGLSGRIPFTGVDIALDNDFGSNKSTLESSISKLRRATFGLGNPVVIIVDEADYLTDNTAEFLYHVLRAIRVDYDDDYPTALVAAGTLRQMYRSMTGTSTDITGGTMNHQIRRLTVPESKELLIKTAATVGEVWSSLDIGPIVELCSGVPRLLHGAGSDLITALNSQATRPTTEAEILDRVRHGVLSTLAFMSLHGRSELAELRSAASGQDLLTYDDARRALAKMEGDPLATLQNLESWGVIDVDDDGLVKIIG